MVNGSANIVVEAPVRVWVGIVVAAPGGGALGFSLGEAAVGSVGRVDGSASGRGRTRWWARGRWGRSWWSSAGGGGERAELWSSEAGDRVPTWGAFPALRERFAATANLVAADGNVGKGGRVLVDKRVHETHLLHAFGHTGFVQERDHGTKHWGGGRGAADGLDLAWASEDLVALCEAGNVRGGTASGGVCGGRWERGGARQVSGHHCFLPRCLRTVYHGREATTGTKLVGRLLWLSWGLLLEPGAADGGDPRGRGWPWRPEFAGGVASTRVARGEDDGDSHVGELHKVGVDFTPRGLFATELRHVALPAVRDRVDLWGGVVGKQEAGPFDEVCAKVRRLFFPEFSLDARCDTHNVLHVEVGLDAFLLTVWVASELGDDIIAGWCGWHKFLEERNQVGWNHELTLELSNGLVVGGRAGRGHAGDAVRGSDHGRGDDSRLARDLSYTWREREAVDREHGGDGARHLRWDGVGTGTVHRLLGLGVEVLGPGGVQKFLCCSD